MPVEVVSGNCEQLVQEEPFTDLSCGGMAGRWERIPSLEWEPGDWEPSHTAAVDMAMHSPIHSPSSTRRSHQHEQRYDRVLEIAGDTTEGRRRSR